jgi:hypothetical protein
VFRDLHSKLVLSEFGDLEIVEKLGEWTRLRIKGRLWGPFRCFEEMDEGDINDRTSDLL